MNPASSCKAFIFSPCSYCAVLVIVLAVLAFATPGFAQVSFQPPSTISSPNLPNDVFIADLNGDGKPDVVATQASSNMVTVFLNNGSGLPSAPSGTFLTGGVATNSVAVADFNEDGIQDIATANCGNMVTVFLNNGSGLPSAPSGTFLTGGVHCRC